MEHSDTGGFQPSALPRTALVIGGSKGVGRAVVGALAHLGVRTAIGYATDDDAANRSVAAAAAVGPKPVLVKGDLSTAAATMVETAASELNSLDALVVTAVPSTLSRVMDVTYEQFRNSMDVQVWGFLEAVRAAAPFLERVGGSAVAVSSLGAQSYTRYYGALGPGKAALELLVRYLGAELGPRNIRVNAVSPCLIDDAERNAGEPEHRQMVMAIGKRTPLRRAAEPADIAKTIVELLGPSFSFMTGQTVIVDGGYSLLG